MTKSTNQESLTKLEEELNSLFDNGHFLMRLNHTESDGEKVLLDDIELEWLKELHPVVDLLSPATQNTRNLFYLYVEKMIQHFPLLKKEGKMDEKVVSVLETLLLSLDYLTNERFINAPFGEDEKEELRAILEEIFQLEKSHIFSSDSNRPVQNTSELYVEGDRIFAKDNRNERNRLYMAVAYRKNENQIDRIRQIGYWIGEIKIPLDRNKVSYEEVLKGNTNVELHEELIYVINRIRLAIAWFLNSYSWKNNELIGFDEFDIASKTRI